VPEFGRAIKFGNSQPMIKAPTKEMVEQLAELQRQLSAAEKQFRELEPTIAAAQAAWEQALDQRQLVNWFPAYHLLAHFELDGNTKGAKDKKELKAAGFQEGEPGYVSSPLGKAAGFDGGKIVGTQILGGSSVTQHWEKGDNPAKKALLSGEVDVLTVSPSGKTLPDPGLEKFAELLLEHNKNGRMTVQASWAGADGNRGAGFTEAFSDLQTKAATSARDESNLAIEAKRIENTHSCCSLVRLVVDSRSTSQHEADGPRRAATCRVRCLQGRIRLNSARASTSFCRNSSCAQVRVWQCQASYH